MSRAEALKRAAESVGFDRAGVTALGRAETGSSFVDWLRAGNQAGMSYLEKRVTRRLDPREVLEGARSAVCVALRYWPLESDSASPGEPDGDDDLWSGVARYARGEDYHDLMLGRLEQLEREISALFPSARTRRYVDTGPILERDLATKAGIGVFGKNCNLLDPEMGSYFLIGEVLTTIELVSDPPLADLCGSCTTCLDECPTGALTGPYRLDSRLCISYWTIEHRGAIPGPMRSEIGKWVFGCDVCQEVCPANVELAAVVHPELELPPVRAELDLSRLLALERDEYVEVFRRSPMKRAKLEGLKRNAALAMGNRGDARFLGPLSRALCDPDAVVRGQAAWSLTRLNLPDEESRRDRRAALEQAAQSELDDAARTELVEALSALE